MKHSCLPKISFNPAQKRTQMRKGRTTNPTIALIINIHTRKSAFTISYSSSSSSYLHVNHNSNIHSLVRFNDLFLDAASSSPVYECNMANMLSTESFNQVNNKTNFHKFIWLLYTNDHHICGNIINIVCVNQNVWLYFMHRLHRLPSSLLLSFVCFIILMLIHIEKSHPPLQCTNEIMYTNKRPNKHHRCRPTYARPFTVRHNANKGTIIYD